MEICSKEHGWFSSIVSPDEFIDNINEDKIYEKRLSSIKSHPSIFKLSIEFIQRKLLKKKIFLVFLK